MEQEKRRDLWSRETELIRKFVELRPLYEQLASESAYILEKKLRGCNIEFSAVTWRAKSLDSFIEKITRKKYDDPINEMSDLAGVRVVYLYSSDFGAVDRIAQQEFTIREKVDKLADQGDERFGYGAVHYIANLGHLSSGARYDDLKNLKCEIQVRTVLQDAWSIISHHLLYKKESDVPTSLRRRINSLAGLLETADDQFDHLRSERISYVRQVEAAISEPRSSLEEEVNFDTLIAFLKLKFPDLPFEGSPGHLGVVFQDDDFPWDRYKKLRDIDKLLDSTKVARQKIRERDAEYRLSALGEFAVAVALDYPPYRARGWGEEGYDFGAFEGLVSK